MEPIREQCIDESGRKSRKHHDDPRIDRLLSSDSRRDRADRDVGHDRADRRDRQTQGCASEAHVPHAVRKGREPCLHRIVGNEPERDRHEQEEKASLDRFREFFISPFRDAAPHIRAPLPRGGARRR